jgi:transmembrane sensor
MPSKAQAMPQTLATAAERDQLEQQAAHWLVRLQSQPDNAALAQGLQSWRARSLAHEQAWRSVEQSLGQLRQQFQHMPPTQGAVLAQTLERADRAHSRRRALGQLAALAVLVPSASWLVQSHLPWQRLVASHSTATGERREFMLADGSRLLLNTDSAVSLKFDPGQRLLQLDRGEIYVISGADHASPQHRPLTVGTPQGRIVALGTRFSVRLQAPSHPAACIVCVDQGAVQLRLQQALQPSPPLVAQSGESYLLHAEQTSRLDAGPMRANSWINGQLVVHNMALGAFLREVSRYRPGYLGCHPQVAALRISGTYLLDDTTALLRLLVETLPIEIRMRTPYWAYVRPSAQA